MQAQPLKAINVFSLGCCALCAQSIFIRELMALFTGTEFVVGALLAGWLFWVGAGAVLGGRFIVDGSAPSYRRFASLAILLAVLLPATVVGIRLGRGMIARPPGALPSPGTALGFSLLVMAPFGFSYGAVYNIASALAGARADGLRGGISKVYLWEAAGSCFGALLFSLILIVFFSQFQAALIASLLLVLSVVPSTASTLQRSLWIASILAVSFALAALSSSIDRKSIESVYRSFRVERFYSSRYGEVVLAAQGEVQSVFAGGGRLFSRPEPERTEEVIQIPLLMTPEPRAVLLVGGSLGGGWEEARKHPSVTSIDCVELDGSLFTLNIGGARPRAGGIEPDVRFIAADGRFYLSRAGRRYDCIVLSSPPPVNLQWNRFYTREFFRDARNSLNPGGVFAFTHPSSENYLSLDQAKVLRILEITLERVFRHVLVLPGSTVHFIASDAELDPGEILTRLRERAIDAPFVSEDYLPFRFTRERCGALQTDLARASISAVNTDARPVLPFYELILEGRRAGSRFTGAFRSISRVPPSASAAILAVLLFAAFGASRRRFKARLAIWSVGFASFLFQFLVLLSYQSFSGLLYRGIVLLTALFMGGAAAGALVSIRCERRGRSSLRWLHAGFIVLAIALASWSGLRGSVSLSYAAGSCAAMLLAGAGGFLTGSYYPIVVRTAFPEKGGPVPATFYAWDVFGACVGGIMGGFVFFPLFGLAGTALFIVSAHVCALLFLVGKW